VTTNPVLYATHAGSEPLPVIDITHPAFRIVLTEAEIERLTDEYVAETQQRPPLSPEAQDAIRRSRLGGAIVAASGTYLTGIATYLLKLGPVHFGEGAHPVDRRIAASYPVQLVRLRLQDMAELLADGIARVPSSAARPLHFINIAGGPAADSWNALIQLRAAAPHLLADRDIAISVLDRDEGGPAFGARALDALCLPPGPLHGLARPPLRHVAYDWSRAGTDLAPILADLRAQEALCAISSEGGLFEYGADEEIIANLTALRAGTPADALIVGSVTRNSEASRAVHPPGGPATRPRFIEEFRALAQAAGWVIDDLRTRPFAYSVRLVKA
jgi:hypothetical protein